MFEHMTTTPTLSSASPDDLRTGYRAF
jgi:hypothetical protein